MYNWKTRSLVLFSYFGEFSKSCPEPFLCLYSCCWFYVQTTDVQAQISIAVFPTCSSAFWFPSTRSRNEIVFSLGRSPQSHLVIKKLAISLDRNTTFGCCNWYPTPTPPPKREIVFKHFFPPVSLQLGFNVLSTGQGHLRTILRFPPPPPKLLQK